jgi:hypothetical protein
MSSQKQIEANRKNGQKSKGPRTAAGKARASRNSRKHALCTISRNNPLYAPRIEAIARAICSEATNAELWEQALIIGECTTVLACTQAERIARIERLLGRPCVHIADSQGAGGAKLGASQSMPAPPWDEPPRNEHEAISLAAPDLNRLERYERRALSRRKRAIETFMAISHMPYNQISNFGRTNPNRAGQGPLRSLGLSPRHWPRRLAGARLVNLSQQQGRSKFTASDRRPHRADLLRGPVR